MTSHDQRKPPFERQRLFTMDCTAFFDSQQGLCLLEVQSESHMYSFEPKANSQFSKHKQNKCHTLQVLFNQLCSTPQQKMR